MSAPDPGEAQARIDALVARVNTELAKPVVRLPLTQHAGIALGSVAVDVPARPPVWAIVQLIRAGEENEAVAEEYGLTVEQVRLIGHLVGDIDTTRDGQP